MEFGVLCDTIFRMKETFYTNMIRFVEAKNNVKQPLSVFDEKDEEILKYAYIGNIRNYFNVFEYACMLYNINMIDNILFEKIFAMEILSIYENNIGSDLGIDLQNETSSVYCEIRTAYQNLISKGFKLGGK